MLKAKSIRNIIFSLAILATFGAILARADGPNRVGLVVVHGDGSIAKQCVEFSENELTGLEILERAGLDLNYDVQSMGATVCRLDGEGCSYPQQDCFCQCLGSPCVYWSYWTLDNGDWRYSTRGASNTTASDGDVQGWIWGLGTITEASPPPKYTFNELCAPPVTDTPVPPPTVEPTIPPPPTLAPTDTPSSTPVSPPKIDSFTVDKDSLIAGENTVLSWSLSNADEAFLIAGNAQEGIASPGSKTVAPGLTTVYKLVARNKGGEVSQQLTIAVAEATPTATAPAQKPASGTTRPPTATSAPTQPSTGQTPGGQTPVAADTATATPTETVIAATTTGVAATTTGVAPDTPTPQSIAAATTITPTATIAPLPQPIAIQPQATPANASISNPFTKAGLLSTIIFLALGIPLIAAIVIGLVLLLGRRK